MNFKDFLGSDALQQASLGLLTGANQQQQLALGAAGFLQGRNEQRTRNKTMEWLKANNPEIGSLVETGAISPTDAVKMAWQQKLESEKPSRPIEINGRLVDPNTYSVIADFSNKPEAPETWAPLSPEEVKQMGLPPGPYQRSSKTNKISSLGGPQMNVQLPAEMGARIGLGDQFLEELPSIKQRVASGELDGVGARIQYAAGAGAPADIWRRVETGKEALVRNLTGAGMSVSEAQNQAERYAISSTDSKETMLKKLEGLERDLQATKEGALRARTGEMLSPGGPSAPAPVVDYTDYFKQ